MNQLKQQQVALIQELETLEQSLPQLEAEWRNAPSGFSVRIPRPSGHLFHEHPATDSTVIRPLIPRSSGHP